MEGYTEIQYIREGSVIELEKDTLVEKKFLGLFNFKTKGKEIHEYEIIRMNDEFKATMKVELKHIVTGELKTIEVSPKRRFYYRVIEKL